MFFKSSLCSVFLFGVIGVAGSGHHASAQDQAPNPGKSKAAKVRKVNPALDPIKDIEGLPRVLLIGDSISIGYTLAVREKLKGKANVHRPGANCGPTTAGLENLSAWLETGGVGKKWDVIHFNWGLHDLKYMGPSGENLAELGSPGSHQQVPPEAYRKNLEILVEQLQNTGAKLVWRDTTPIPEGAKGRVIGDALVYNAIAKDVMARAKVPTHELYQYAFERLDRIQNPADVHFTDKGYEILADDVVRVILETLQP